MKKLPCPTCNGSKVVTVSVSYYGSDVHDSFETKCRACDGKGEITQVRAKQIAKESDVWCKCKNADNQSHYVADGQDARCSKHHWRCDTCDKIVQIG